MRTYTSRKRTAKAAIDSDSAEEGPSNRRQSTPDAATDSSGPARKRVKTSTAGSLAKPKQKSLLQLHFCVNQSVIRKCPICGLCYTKGAKEDAELHRAHCNRVQKGLEWGREEEREGYGTSITEIERCVKLKNKKRGRIISFPADVNGKMGSKLAILLETVNLCLSSPSLDQSTLQASKAYVFLVPEGTNTRTERIAGCVIAEHISTAMAVIPPTLTTESPTQTIDIGGVFCFPEPLPTPMGVSRLFVTSTYRRQGIAQRLLSAAASTFIPGCVLDPTKGQIAFSQPTGDGAKVMQSWGGGQVRIYE